MNWVVKIHVLIPGSYFLSYIHLHLVSSVEIGAGWVVRFVTDIVSAPIIVLGIEKAISIRPNGAFFV